MIILDGKKVSEDIKNEITAEVQKMRDNHEKVPHLAAIIVGNDGASLTYVNSKVKACERVGFESTLIRMPSTTSETELLKKIKQLNEDEAIDGFIVQLPLPKQIDTQHILMSIDPSKDVDGFLERSASGHPLQCFTRRCPHVCKPFTVPTPSSR